MDGVVKDAIAKLGASGADIVEEEQTRAHLAERTGGPPNVATFRFAESSLLCVKCRAPKSIEEVFFSQPEYWPRCSLTAMCVDCVSQCK